MKGILRDIAMTVIMAIVIFLALQFTLQVSVINGQSMEPNLHDGQRLLVNKAAYYLNQPERGDIIVFNPPNNPEAVYIKRIIGLPGDTVEIKAETVYIDGSPLDEPYQRPPNYTMDERTVPATEYFVLGDNRIDSNDSHNNWTVPRDNIIGKAWITLWPPQVWGFAPNYPFDEPMVDSTS